MNTDAITIQTVAGGAAGTHRWRQPVFGFLQRDGLRQRREEGPKIGQARLHPELAELVRLVLTLPWPGDVPARQDGAVGVDEKAGPEERRGHERPLPVHADRRWSECAAPRTALDHAISERTACPILVSDSNQTVWPWYSNIAPMSWLIQRDVDEGRRKLNFSEWDRPQKEARESAEKLNEGTMPPWYYPWARLSPGERQNLIRGLADTVGQRQRTETQQERETRG